MAFKLPDRTEQTWTGTGTGAVVPTGSVVGYRDFADVLSDSDTTIIVIDDEAGNWEITNTAYTAAGDSLSRGTLIASSTGSRVDFPAGTKRVWVDADGATILKILAAEDPGHTHTAYLTPTGDGSGLTDIPWSCARFTSTSGDPDPVASVANVTRVYLTPFLGNLLSLLDGSDNIYSLAFTEKYLDLGTLTASKLYDCFAYDNSGTLALEWSAAWTNDTTRADAKAPVKGLWVKAADHTRRLVGTIYTTSTTQTQDVEGTGATLGQRYVACALNPRPRAIFSCPGYSDNNTNSTYQTSSTSWAEANGTNAGRCSWIQSLPGAVSISAALNFDCSSGTYRSRAAIGLDSVTQATGYAGTSAADVTLRGAVLATSKTLAAGKHFAAILISASSGSAVMTVYADLARVAGDAADGPGTFLAGSIMQ